MSAIPPPGHASLIQTDGASQRAAQDKEQKDASAAERSSRDAFADKLRVAIENDDDDSSVYADAEGAGSQGRSEGEPPSAGDEDPQAADDGQDEDDADGHVDVTA